MFPKFDDIPRDDELQCDREHGEPMVLYINLKGHNGQAYCEDNKGG